jgi:glycine hydroxymethyltransferase
MIDNLMKKIEEADSQVGQLIRKEYARQNRNIALIASENIVSAPVLLAVGSVLTNKYAEGYPGRRYYGGCQYVDEIETIAIERAKELFHCNYANVQPHSGAQANYAVYQALCQIGDTVLGMSLDHGGHLTHGSKVNFSGKNYNVIGYGLDPVSQQIDYEQLEQLAREHHPRMIIAGASAYPRIIDFERIGKIAHEVGAYLFVDMAHIAGLVAAGLHPSPFPHADVVTTTTHKTLRGPRGGMILTNDEAIAKKINSAVFPGSQGGPLMHVIAGKAVTAEEACTPEFKDYIAQVVKNTKAMCGAFIRLGYDIVTGGTDNHLFLVDFTRTHPHLSGKDVQNELDRHGITLNKNCVPGEKRSPAQASGVRIGCAAMTTRGWEEADAIACAERIHKIISAMQAE